MSQNYLALTTHGESQSLCPSIVLRNPTDTNFLPCRHFTTAHSLHDIIRNYQFCLRVSGWAADMTLLCRWIVCNKMITVLYANVVRNLDGSRSLERASDSPTDHYTVLINPRHGTNENVSQKWSLERYAPTNINWQYQYNGVGLATEGDLGSVKVATVHSQELRSIGLNDPNLHIVQR